jgi:hypothetical protein
MKFSTADTCVGTYPVWPVVLSPRTLTLSNRRNKARERFRFLMCSTLETDGGNEKRVIMSIVSRQLIIGNVIQVPYTN